MAKCRFGRLKHPHGRRVCKKRRAKSKCLLMEERNGRRVCVKRGRRGARNPYTHA
jgi:hypothetical protein